MSDQANYFKLGLFLLVGTLFLVVVVLVLGAGQVFTRSVTLETYFNESVNGLEVGSPVKFRGVRVGTVDRIAFVSEEYSLPQTAGVRYVYVECRLDQGPLKEADEDHLKDMIPFEVSKGLRVRPTSLGLTGQLFLEIDYVLGDPGPILPVDWPTRHMYVPSAPSTMSRVEGAISAISNSLESINKSDVTQIIENLRGVTESLRNLLASQEGAAIPALITANLEQSRSFLARLNQIMAHRPVENLLPEAVRVLTGVRRLVEASEGDAVAAVHEMRGAAASMNRVGTRLAEFLEGREGEQGLSTASSTLRNVQEATSEMNHAARRMGEVMERLNALAAEQQQNLQGILDNARQVMENLKELTGEAKRYPSEVIFGGPPRAVEPGGRK